MQYETEQVLEALQRSVEATAKAMLEQEGAKPDNLYHDIIGIVDKVLLEFLMGYTRHSQSKSAKILGMSRNTLRTKLIAYFGDKYCKNLGEKKETG